MANENIAALFLDEYNLKILSACDTGYRTARELSATGIPIATINRRLRLLRNAGLLLCAQPQRRPRGGSLTYAYASNVHSFVLEFKASLQTDDHLGYHSDLSLRNGPRKSTEFVFPVRLFRSAHNKADLVTLLLNEDNLKILNACDKEYLSATEISATCNMPTTTIDEKIQSLVGVGLLIAQVATVDKVQKETICISNVAGHSISYEQSPATGEFCYHLNLRLKSGLKKDIMVARPVL